MQFDFPEMKIFERGLHKMKTVFKGSRWLTTIFLVLGFALYLVYVFYNLQQGGRTTDDVTGWIIFDAIVFDAIIVGMWSKKAPALVTPALICLVSINLAINSINYLSFYHDIGDSAKPQLNVWMAALNATACYIALIAFLLSYLFVSKAKLFRIIGILMLLEVCLGYRVAGIVDLSTGYSIDGIWDFSIGLIGFGMVFGSLYLEGERENQLSKQIAG